VALKRGLGDNRIYALIAFFILIVIILAFIFSSNQLIHAYIPNKYLSDGWAEDIEERVSDSQLLSSFCSFTYKNNNESYPAYVTVTTRKTLFMMSENELMDETIKTIKGASEQGIVVDEDTQVSGKRVLSGGKHETMYVTYNATDNSNGVSEDIKIIGETWNCGTSGTSIICIGVSQITDNAHNNPGIVTMHWAKIVRDKDGSFGLGEYNGEHGLLFNVKCH